MKKYLSLQIRQIGRSKPAQPHLSLMLSDFHGASADKSDRAGIYIIDMTWFLSFHTMKEQSHAYHQVAENP